MAALEEKWWCSEQRECLQKRCWLLCFSGWAEVAFSDSLIIIKKNYLLLQTWTSNWAFHYLFFISPLTDSFDWWIILLNGIKQARWPQIILLVYRSQKDLNRSSFIPARFFSPSQVICIPAGLCSLFEKHSLNLRCILFVSSPPSAPPPLCLQLFHMQNYVLRKCMQTLFPQQRSQFFQVISKETSVPQVSCVVLGWWEGLCNPELVVKSCLSKSEVMFFFCGARAWPDFFNY